MRTIAILVVLTVTACLALACRSKKDPESVESTSPGPGPVEGNDRIVKPIGGKKETGNCSNELIDGQCTFEFMFEQDPGSNAPQGKAYFKIVYTVVEGEKKIMMDNTVLRIPQDRQEDLKAHLEENSPVACTAYIVRPPCNPQATSVTPKTPYPDWVHEERF